MKEIHETEHGDPAVVHEPDGCPMEGAVLKREWRRLTKELAEARAPIAQPADAATAQESMDVLDQPERSFDTYAAKLQKLLKEARDIAAETLIESMKRAQEITALKDQLSTAEKKARELGEALARKESDRQYHMNQINRLAKAAGALGETSEMVVDLAIALFPSLLPPTPAQEQAGGAATISNDSSGVESRHAETDLTGSNSGVSKTESERSASPAVTSLPTSGESAALLPFDLAKALAGTKVVTRDGREMTQLSVRVDGMLTGLLSDDRGDIPCVWAKDGRAWSYRESPLDLFLAPAPGNRRRHGGGGMSNSSEQRGGEITVAQYIAAERAKNLIWCFGFNPRESQTGDDSIMITSDRGSGVCIDIYEDVGVLMLCLGERSWFYEFDYSKNEEWMLMESEIRSFLTQGPFVPTLPPL